MLSASDSQAERYLRFILRTLLLATLLLVVLVPLRSVSVGIETQARLEVSSMDEAAMVHRVLDNLRHGNLDPRGEFNYGAFYPTVATGILAGIGTLGIEPTDKRTALTCRLIAWACYLGLLALVFSILRLLGVSIEVSLLSMLLLASGPDLHYWSQHVHPDVPQAFLIALAFWIVARRQSWPWAVLAAFVCGVAFGTKYSGAFPALFVLLPALLSKAERDPAHSPAPTRRTNSDTTRLRVNDSEDDLDSKHRPLRSSIVWLLASVAAFIAGWIVFNPYVLVSTQEFWRDLQFERVHVGFGHYIAEPRNPLHWFAVWFRETRPEGVWLVLVGLVLGIVHLTRAKLPSGRLSAADRRFLWIVATYVAICALHLGAAVVMRRMRYAYHFWPLLFVLVGWGLDRGLDGLRRRSRAVAVGASLLAVGSGILLGLSTASSSGARSTETEDPIFAAAQWMAQHYQPSTPIVADAYFYRHPHFENILTVPGVQPRNLIEHEAFVVVLLQRTSGRGSWKAPGTRFVDRQFILGARPDAEAIQQFHRELTGPASPYHVAYESESVVVLELKDEVFNSDPPSDRTPGSP